MAPRNREIGLIVSLETFASCFGIEQCEDRKVRQIETFVKDQLCQLAAIGEKRAAMAERQIVTIFCHCSP